MSLGGGGLPLSPARHIAESTAAGVSESSSSNAGGSSKESRVNLRTIDEPILPLTSKIVETEDFVNRSPQIATNTQELGRTVEKASPAKELPKEQKTHELLSKTLGGVEDSTIQAGKAGDIKQEIKNPEEKVRKESYLKTRPAKKTTTARTNIKKDGSDENS